MYELAADSCGVRCPTCAEINKRSREQDDAWLTQQNGGYVLCLGLLRRLRDANPSSRPKLPRFGTLEGG